MERGQAGEPGDADRAGAAPPTRPGPGTTLILFVFAAGAAAGLMAAFVGAGVLEDSARLIVAVFLVALTMLAVAGGVILLFRRRILRRLFGMAETEVENFAGPLGQVAQGALARDAEAATRAARDLVALALARYAWITTRRWIVTSLTALVAAMAALAGSALLFKQNALLSQQNAKIDLQTELLQLDVQLAEAARNAELAAEITDIAALLGAAAAASAAGMDLPEGTPAVAALVNVIDPVTGLDRALMLRIVAASQAARPYRFLHLGVEAADDVDNLRVALGARRDELPNTVARLQAAYGWVDPRPGARLTERPVSPERGQLLRVLLAAGLRDLGVLNHFGLDLSHAHAPWTTLVLLTAQGARLNHADLTGADIRGSDLGGAWLMNARFDRADIRATRFDRIEADRVQVPFRDADAPYPSFLSGASFRDAVVIDSGFAGAMMLAADFDGALLWGVDFRGAVLGAATLRGAVLVDVEFAGADLRSVDLDGAHVFGADALERLAEVAEPGRFDATRFVLEPVSVEEVLEVRAAGKVLAAEDLVAATGGLPAFRVRRTGAFAD